MSDNEPNDSPAEKVRGGALNVEDVRRLLDACWKAKRITELLPSLPKGMKPRHVHVIDAIWHINEPSGQHTAVARVGDVSSFLDVTTPSVTKLVNELVRLGLVEKHATVDDRRAVTLTLTEQGKACRRTYVEQYHAHLMHVLAPLAVDQCNTTVDTLNTALRLMNADLIQRDKTNGPDSDSKGTHR